MMFKGHRAVLLVSLALPLVVGVEAASAACTEPALRIQESRAKAGAEVPFSLSGLTPGAEYLVKVGDNELTSGVASSTDVSGKFKMPDLGGKSRKTPVEAVLAHDQCENSPWKVTQPLRFRASAQKQSATGRRQGQNPSVDRERIRLQQELRRERQKQQAEERKQARERKQEAKKRQAAAVRRKARAKKQRALEAKRRARQKALAKQRAQQQQKAAQTKGPGKKAGAPKQGAKTPQSAVRQGENDGSRPFIALGMLYALLGCLGAGGFFLWRRSQRGPSLEELADAKPPPMIEYGEGYDVTPRRKQIKPVPGLGDEEDEEDEEEAASELEETKAAEPVAVSGKETLEGDLRRILTEAGVDAELEGILADAQAEAERLGVPMDAEMMMQVLTDGNGGDGETKLSVPTEGQLRTKLQEIVAEEKERVAARPES